MKKLLTLLLAASLFYACSGPASKDAAGSFNLDSVKASIQAANASFVDAMKKGDTVAFLNCYTKDACLLPPNSPKLCTAADMVAFFKGAHGMGITSMSLTTTEVLGNKDMVSEDGTYEMFGQDGKSMDKGKYLTTWKQEDGKWKLYRDMFSSDMPPPPAPPAMPVKK